MMEEFLFHPPFRERSFVGFARVWNVFEKFGERDNRMFRGLDKDPSEVWSLVRFRVSLFFFFF